MVGEHIEFLLDCCSTLLGGLFYECANIVGRINNHRGEYVSFVLTVICNHCLSRKKSPLRVNLNVGGMTVQGNLTQYQVNGGGLITYDGKVYGSDTVINGYRMWTKFPGSDELTKIGDDLNIVEIPYYYVRPKVYVQGFANYSTSQLHQIDDRYLGGVSIGYTPIRQKMKALSGICWWVLGTDDVSIRYFQSGC